MNLLSRLDGAGSMQVFHVLRQGGVVLTSVLLAKSALSTSEIGEWEQLLFIGYTFSFFWASGLVQGLLTIYPKFEIEKQKALIFNTYLLFLVLSLAVALLICANDGAWLAKILNKAYIAHSGLYAWVLFLQMPVYLLENFYLLENQPKKILFFGVFSSVGQVLSIGIPVWIGEGIAGGLMGLGIFHAFRHLWLLIFILKKSRIKPEFSLWTRLLMLSLPLIGYSALGGIQIALANWFVAWFFPGDTTAFAVYRYGAQELPFAMALSSGLGLAFLPELVKNRKLALSAIKNRSLKLFHWLFPVAIIIMLTSDWLFPFVFRDSFEGSVPIFKLFLLIIITRMVFARTVLIGLEANREVWWISVAEILCFAGLGFVLGSIRGLEGIAFATLLTFTFEKAMLVWMLHRKFGIWISDYTDMRWFSLYAFLMFAAYFFSGNFGM